MYVLMYTTKDDTKNASVMSVGAATLTTVRRWRKKFLGAIPCVWRVFDCSDGTWVDSSDQVAWEAIQAPPRKIDLVVLPGDVA